MEAKIRGWHRRRTEPEEDELAKVEMAVRQLERAELYVVSAINLDLGCWEHRQALHDLRCHLLEVRDLVNRPRPLE